MKDAFRVFWQGLRSYWDELLHLPLMNALTLLLLVPALIGLWNLVGGLIGARLLGWIDWLVIALELALAILFPPALAGLWRAANQAAEGNAVHWRDYLEGFRSYFWKAWALALLNVCIVLILLSNVWFYVLGNAPFGIGEDLGFMIGLFFALIAFLWLAYQIYPLALLLEQTDKRLRVALRNGLVLFRANPGFTITLALLLLISIVISSYLFPLWGFFTLAFLAVVCNHAVKHTLEPHRERLRAEAAGEQKAGDAGSGV